MDADPILTFGQFDLVPARRELSIGGVLVPLGPRALDILICLVTRRETTVSKEDLLTFVWPNRTVADNNLTVHMSALRRALRDGGDGNQFVQTVPGRGYRFIAPVDVREASTARRARPGSLAKAAWRPGLPQSASRFIGRAAELAEIEACLATHRLVTITGIGGIGKTRIALQIATNLAARYPDGVWLTDLAPVIDPSLALEAIASSFNLGGVEASSVPRLVSFLADQKLLLVLDNCEHLVDRIAGIIQAILSSCPGVAVLATSRESLAIDGENIYRLPSLPFPDESEPIDAATALRHDAVRLFVDRAAISVSGFVLDDVTAPDVARICRRLDGIALAIEMAAPRLQVLSAGQLAQRLNERFRLLTTHHRAALPRHRTLRAVIDWSHDLLSDPERVLLRRLAVFVGGANLEAVLAVTAENVPDDADILDLLTALVDKSLVVTELSGSEPRYRLLETTRQYALEKLAESGEEWCQRAHAAHFATVFERAEAEWPTAQTTAWLDAYGPDTDNLRAALEWAFAPGGDALLGQRLSASSYPLWWDLPQLPLQESRRWFDLAVSRITGATPASVAARLWFGKSWRDVGFGDRENLAAAAQAVTLYRQTNEPVGLGAALWRAGSALFTAETADQARACFDEAEQLLRGQMPTKWLALCLVKQGDVRFRSGELGAALAAYEEAMRLTRASGNWYGLMNGGSNMAELLFHLGQPERALAQLHALRDELLRGRRTPLMATLAAHLLLAGRTDEAVSAAREAVTYAGAIGLPAALAWTIETLGLKLALDGVVDQATRFAGYARKIHPSVATRAGSRRAVFIQLQNSLTSAMADAEREQRFTEGARWNEAQAAEEAARACGAD